LIAISCPLAAGLCRQYTEVPPAVVDLSSNGCFGSFTLVLPPVLPPEFAVGPTTDETIALDRALP
jgi:hypothetical protein